MGQTTRETTRTSPQWTIAVLVATVAVLLVGMLASAAKAPVPPTLIPVVTAGLASPLHVTHAGDGSGRLFLVEQAGLIRIIRNGMVLATPFLDIRSRVVSGGETGLLSVAFHPNYASNGRFFVNYTANRPGLTTVIGEYHVSAGNPDVANSTETVILQIPQPFTNHNGGLNKFGPDGMFYIGMGDGGSSGDPQNHGQRLDTLLGKLLRINVTTLPYSIPPDNPFVGQAGARGEIWAYGLRNPWRWSFDRVGGRLFLADVGQNNWEEVDLIQRGGNYGWRIMEGAHCFNPPSGCSTAGLILPIAEYNHSEGCSVTGGYVYRGSQLPQLRGRYLFGDFCSGKIWSLREARGGGTWVRELLLQTSLSVSSFGEDQAGEVYVVDLLGGLYRIGPSTPQPTPNAR